MKLTRATRWMMMAAAGVLLATVGFAQQAQQTAKPIPIAVYKSPTCGCCAKWIDHLRANGFEVTVTDQADMTPTKDKHGIAPPLRSCHTGIVNGYIVEGHVPADLVKKMITERPKIAGLAVPGMPMGSPGMEGPRKDPYDVLAFDKAGQTTVYAKR